MQRLGHFLVRRRWLVMGGTLLTLLLAAVFGGGVADHLTTGGFEDPETESFQAFETLEDDFEQAPPNFLLLITAKQGTVDDDPARRRGIELTNALLKEEDVGNVLSHWSLGPLSPLVSEDRTKALVIAQLQGTDDEINERVDLYEERFNASDDEVDVAIGGFQSVFNEVGQTIEDDLARSEAFAFPITLILLVIVFGSIVAAGLPLAVGGFAIIVTFLVLRVIASVTDVSVFALSMVTAMGLGLAIDYSLFIVSRFREQLRAGDDVETAVVTTVRTAGRTILFSGITVGVSLSALLIFPLAFLRSFGYAGMGVVATAVVGSVIFLPSALAALGHRVDNWAVWKRHPKEVGEGFWHRLAVFVMRRPVPVTVVVVAFLLVLGIPFLRVNLGLPDERVLQPGSAVRDVHDTIREEFPSEEVLALRVVAADIGNPVQRRDEVTSFATSLSELDNVDRVDTFAGAFTDGQKTGEAGPLGARFLAPEATWLQVVPSTEAFSPESEQLVQDIRALDGPFDVLVGGSSAELVDVKGSLIDALPVAIGLISGATFLLLFLMFGSLLVPLKALVLNFLSLTATFGAMVWIFQDGNWSGVLDFTSTGTLDITAPILMFCIAFGLSMDYEVFLLSRIKEEYDKDQDNERSVAVGLERTGRIVTAAALLISVVFLSFSFSGVRFIKLFGIGLALAVLMDAFVIRGTLVPAFMRLAGRANWWLPGWLRPLHARVQISEGEVITPAPTTRRTAPTRPKPKPKTRKPAKAKKPTSRKKPAARKKPTSRKKPAKRKPAARKAAPRRKR